ncbi:MAG: hypothetical protein H0X37_23410 [Herpetosiphonaceae bacterium]|nr:hypothetical protein [Herpetosiphonaceae bacterium]
MSIKKHYVDAQHFEHVGWAFQVLGYMTPEPETPGGGATVASIIAQYQKNMSEGDALDVVAFGLLTSDNMLVYYMNNRGGKGSLALKEVRGSAERWEQRYGDKAAGSKR